MANFSCEKNIFETKDVLFDFFSDFNNWATLIPKYLDHGEENGKLFWVFEGDFGIIKKAVKVSLDISVNKENNTVDFLIHGLSDSIEGRGSFFIQDLSDTESKIITTLDLSATGFLAMMMNPILDDFVPKLTKEFSDNIVLSFSK